MMRALWKGAVLALALLAGGPSFAAWEDSIGNLSLDARTRDSLSVTWPAWPDAPEYEVRYWTKADWSAGNRGATKTVVVTPVNAVALTGLEAGTEYVIRAFVKYPSRTWRASAPFYASTAEAPPREPDPVPQQSEPVIVVEEPPVEEEPPAPVEEEPQPAALEEVPLETLFDDAVEHPDAVPQLSDQRPGAASFNRWNDFILGGNLRDPKLGRWVNYTFQPLGENQVPTAFSVVPVGSSTLFRGSFVTGYLTGENRIWAGNLEGSIRRISVVEHSNDWIVYGHWFQTKWRTGEGFGMPHPEHTLHREQRLFIGAGGSRPAVDLKPEMGAATYSGTAHGIVRMEQSNWRLSGNTLRQDSHGEFFASFADRPFSLAVDFASGALTGEIDIGDLDGRWRGIEFVSLQNPNPPRDTANEPHWRQAGVDRVTIQGRIDMDSGTFRGNAIHDQLDVTNGNPVVNGDCTAMGNCVGANITAHGSPDGPHNVGDWKIAEVSGRFYGDPESPDAPGLVSMVFELENADRSWNHSAMPGNKSRVVNIHIRGAFGGAKE